MEKWGMRTHDLPSHNHATAFVWGTVHGKEGGVAIPTTNGGVQRTEAQSEHVHVARTVFFFRTCGRRLARSVGACRQNSRIGAQEEVCQE